MKKKLSVLMVAAVIAIGFILPSSSHAAFERVPKITSIESTSFYALAD